MKSIAVLPILAATLFACSNNHEATQHGGETAHGADHEHADHDHGDGAAAADSAPLFEGAKLDEAAWTHYGAGVHAGDATAVAEVLADPEAYTGKPVRIAGPIAAVCQQKGCWVRVGEEQANVFTKFKDYGFFLPTDASGEVVLEGYVTIETVSVEELKHYLEDEGKPEEAAKVTEPEKQVQFLAHGVAVKK